MGGKHDNKERCLNRGHLFPRVSENKRCDIEEVDSTEFRVHL